MKIFFFARIQKVTDYSICKGVMRVILKIVLCVQNFTMNDHTHATHVNHFFSLCKISQNFLDLFFSGI